MKKNLIKSVLIAAICFSFNANSAMEISIKTKVEEKTTLVFSNNGEVINRAIENLKLLPNLNIKETNNSCEKENLLLKTSYFCIESSNNNNDTNVFIYEKNKDKINKKIEFKTNSSEERSNVNSVSSYLYKRIFGTDTVFKNKLAYVERKSIAKGKNIYNLKISDFDGKNQKVLLASTQPILSISWSPDNKKIAYVSYERVRPSVYIMDLEKMKRKQITSFKGINAYPSWSNDGREIALSLSNNNNSDIYIYNIVEDKIRKLTNFKYDVTEPTWVNNDEIITTSNKTGSPKLYKLNIKEKTFKALSKNYNYTTSSRINDKKDKVYSVFSQSGNYGILETVLFNGKENVIIKDKYAESPSISKDGEFIIYSTKENNNDILKVVDRKGVLVYSIKSRNSLKEPSYSN